MKVAINKRIGGFSLSQEAIKECISRGMTCVDVDVEEEEGEAADFRCWSEADGYKDYAPTIGRRDTFLRTHPIVLAVIEDLGERANGRICLIKIVEVPDDLTPDDILICEGDDGREWIAEKHRTWD